jgi:hypothetical protein
MVALLQTRAVGWLYNAHGNFAELRRDFPTHQQHLLILLFVKTISAAIIAPNPTILSHQPAQVDGQVRWAAAGEAPQPSLALVGWRTQRRPRAFCPSSSRILMHA